MLSSVFLTVCVSGLVSGTQLERGAQSTRKEGSPLMLYYVTRVDKLYDQVRDLQTKALTPDEHLQKTVSKLSSEVAALKSEIRKTAAVRDTVVYFRALRSSRKSFGAGSTVVFDKVDANIGGGYNPTSGVFTAPVSGLYEFKCQLENVDVGAVDYVISSQGKKKALLTLSKPWTSNYMSAVFHVTSGTHVWIVGDWDDGKKPKIREGVWSQFSGYLLSKD